MKTRHLLLVVGLCASCAEPPVGEQDAFAREAALSAEEAAGVLEVANTLSIVELDDDVGLDRRAAIAIVAARDEDGDFEELAALDALPWVGATALALLAGYARAHGYVEGLDLGPACLIISEYAEGSGSNNKAVEIWNCGESSVRLGDRALCLARNDDAGCSVSAEFDDIELAPGATWVVCRTMGGTFNDPLQSLRDRCDQEMPGVVAMSGDDRLAVLDDDGSVLDAFGRLAVRPSASIWADAVFDRCDLEPYRGTGSFSADARFVRRSGNTHANLGKPPGGGC
jgi:hypothetical protein